MTDYKQLFETYLNNVRFDGALTDAMDYVIRDGGHRIRPQLVLAWCEACGGDVEKTLPLALAVECVHSMSLVHDDLPCMDNSPERRGKESIHVKMGENAAVLCGDKLLSLAFDLIANSDLNYVTIVNAIRVLSQAACDMADAQYLELRSETHSKEEWISIHKGKTAVLLSAACQLGVLAAGGTVSDLSQAHRYGTSLGLGYQLLDDVRDGDGMTAYYDESIVTYLRCGYISDCNIGTDTSAREFLTAFARRVLA